jgi:tRNA(fMet)-specific endonuclease VapC
MILLDTDHLTILKYTEHPRCAALLARMQATPGEVFATTVINVEEQMRGWLAKIHGLRDFHDQILPYSKLAGLFDFFKDWQLIPFDERAADETHRLKKMRLRLGTPDLKIAAIALVQNALLLSANLGDFNRVPGLRVESWLDETDD